MQRNRRRALSRFRCGLLVVSWAIWLTSGLWFCGYVSSNWWISIGRGHVYLEMATRAFATRFIHPPPAGWQIGLETRFPPLFTKPWVLWDTNLQIVDIPFLWPLVLCSIFVGWPGIRAMLRHRRGQCRFCGYDLRGMTDRCPECGEPIGTTKRG